MVIQRSRIVISAGAALLALIGIAFMLNNGFSGRSSAALARQIGRGKAVYDSYCAECHGIGGEGEYPQAPLDPGPDGLMGAPPHNENGHTWHHADDLLVQRIEQGSRYPGFKPMPAFAETLTDAEVEAVLAYIKTMWTEEQREIQAEVTASQPRSDVPTIRELTENE